MPGTFLLTAYTPTTAARGAEEHAAAVAAVLNRLPWPTTPHGESRDQQDRKGLITVAAAADLADEGYRLTVSETAVSIEAGGVAGAFYAAQTLRQLLPDDAWRANPPASAPAPAPAPATASPAGWPLPCVQIEDAPALAWRGAHLDVARHFFPKRELLSLIDALAALKLNRVHLHLTDDQGWRIESRRYPALHEIGSHRTRSRLSLGGEEPPVYDETPHGGYYTLADLAEITAYAAQRMITIVPEIDLPGHASALLAALPEFGAGSPPPGGYQVLPDWGIFPYLISPLPKTMEFLREIFAELLEAAPAKYVHIGGDECVLVSWKSDPGVTAYREQRGLATPADLHAAFLRDVADMLSADFGARAVVWDEGFASAGDQPGMLRDDTIVMAWRGMGIARRAAEAGHEVVAAPVLPTYFDYYQSDDPAEPAGIGGPVGVRDVAAFSPVPADWPEAARRRLIGTQFQVWTEYIPTSRELEYMIFPRACALADVAWAGSPAIGGEPGRPGDPARPDQEDALTARLAAHLARLDAAGVEYRPLDGPRPWQQGGAGPRRHRPGYRIQEVTAHLDGLAETVEGA